MFDLLLVFSLLIAFQIKHFVVDFVIQLNGKKHLNKFSNNWKDAFWALFIHGSHHGIFTFLIAVSFGVNWLIAAVLMLADWFIHALIDGVKASPYLLGRHNFPDKKYFYALGLDQAAHHFTHYAIIFAILVSLGG